MSRDLGARSGKPRHVTPDGFVRHSDGMVYPLPDLPPRKEDAACCVARRDDVGRLPIGFCSPDCVRRPRKNP